MCASLFFATTHLDGDLQDKLAHFPGCTLTDPGFEETKGEDWTGIGGIIILAIVPYPKLSQSVNPMRVSGHSFCPTISFRL